MTLHSVVSVKSLVSWFIEVFFLIPLYFCFQNLFRLCLSKGSAEPFNYKNILRETQHLTPLQSTQCNVAQAAEKNI